MNLRELFARNFKYYRKQAQISQMKLAEMCETSSNYVGEIETGKKFPSPEMMEKISDVLGVSPWCFLYEEDAFETSNKNHAINIEDKLSIEKKEQLSLELTTEVNSKIKEILSKY